MLSKMVPVWRLMEDTFWQWKLLLFEEAGYQVASLEEKTLPVASVVFRGAVFWEVSSILALLYHQVKGVTSLLCMWLQEGKWCILEQPGPWLRWEPPMLSKRWVVSDSRPSWVNSTLSQCCFSHVLFLHCFWLLLLDLFHWLLLPSCSKSLFSEFLTMSYILIFCKRLSHMPFISVIISHISKYCINICHLIAYWNIWFNTFKDKLINF